MTRYQHRSRQGGTLLRLEVADEAFAFLGSAEYRRDLFRRLVIETVDWLDAIRSRRERFLRGGVRPPMTADLRRDTPSFAADTLLAGGQQVMQAWETPLMTRMARAVAGPGLRVLEIGHGMGIASRAIQAQSPASHTIVEVNPAIAARARAWAAAEGLAGVRVVEADWRAALPELGRHDAVLFDVFTLTEAEAAANARQGLRPFDAFVDAVPSLLRPGGACTFFVAEFDSLSRHLQHRLLARFERVGLELVQGLEPPADCHYWFAREILLVVAHGLRDGG